MSHPDYAQWSGDEPDPYEFEPRGRCDYCGAFPDEECEPWCHEDIDVAEREP